MKKTNMRITAVRMGENMVRTDALRERLYMASMCGGDELLRRLGTPADGLTEALAARSREEHGENVLAYGKKDSTAGRLASAFISPFTLVLLALAVVSVFTDIVLAEPGERSWATVCIILAMVMISGVLRYVQETRSGNVAE